MDLGFLFSLLIQLIRVSNVLVMNPTIGFSDFLYHENNNQSNNTGNPKNQNLMGWGLHVLLILTQTDGNEYDALESVG